MTGNAVTKELADAVRLTLVGFVRDASFNVYTHPERVIGTPGTGTAVR